MGIRFTETMKGHFSTSVKDGDYKRAEEQGKQSGSAMQFTLTIESDDLDALIEQPEHAAGITGTVTASALSAQPLTVTEGTFNLFVSNPEGVDLRNMDYRMKLRSQEGKTFLFKGFKQVDDGSLLHLWPQTTTLYVTVYQGDDESGPVEGRASCTSSPPTSCTR